MIKKNVAEENPKSAAVFYFLLFQQCWWKEGIETMLSEGNVEVHHGRIWNETERLLLTAALHGQMLRNEEAVRNKFLENEKAKGIIQSRARNQKWTYYVGKSYAV